MAARPVLWHLPISHYSEKARWALEYKSVEHDRKAPPGGAHMAIALALTRGRHHTFPVLRWNGTTTGDSTAIIAELERRVPEPALYPHDPEERDRALALEDWFDENLGAHARLLGWHELTQAPELMQDLTMRMLPAPMRRFPRLAAAGAKTFVNLRFRVADPLRADAARAAVLAAFDRLEAELGGREYLVGDRFTVADLTAAALFYPVVLPPEGPRFVDQPPAPLARFREAVSGRTGFRWVEEMFRRHRR